MEHYHFTDLKSFCEFFQAPLPEHPLFNIVSSELDEHSIAVCENHPIRVSSDFYTISLKKVIGGEILYGRTKYDCQNGTMLFIAPGQEIEIREVKVSGKFTTICFHKDFIRGWDIQNRMKKYHFFAYSTNEALHLSPKEERLMDSIFVNIEAEYHNNQDEFSKDIILSQLDTVLKYANRFYKRQFLNRQEMSGSVFSQFETLLSTFFEEDRLEVNGVPQVEDMAKELGLSPRYLSDSLKVETGKTAIEHIHLYLIEEAKNLLLEPRFTVSETAYHLGFEYPQYFSRLFKKKVGISPTEYRNQYIH